MQTHKISDIQVLRAVAILSVLLAHLSLPNSLIAAAPKPVHLPFWAGVELFFAISGYVVTGSVFKGSLAPVPFIIRRALRLWPAMVVFLALTALIAMLAHIATPQGSWAQSQVAVAPSTFAIEAVAMMFGVLINLPWREYAYVNAAMWSLSVEFQFYAGYFLVLVAIRLMALDRNSAGRLILVLFTTIFIGTQVTRQSGLSGGSIPELGTFFVYIVRTKIDFMLLGSIAYLVFSRISLPKSVTQWGPHISPWLLLLPLCLAAISEDPLQLRPPFIEAVTLPFMCLCFTAVVVLASGNAAFPSSRGTIYRTMLWIGDRSYSIYLFHFPVMALTWMIEFWATPPAVMASPFAFGLIQAAIALPITMLLADLSYRLVETPWTQVGSALARRREAVEQSGSAGRAPI